MSETADPHVLTYFETNFWMHGCFPDPDEVKLIFDLSDDAFKKQVKLIIPALENRGLDCTVLKDIETPPPVKMAKVRELVLDPEFVLAVNIICDTTDKRSTSAKLKTAGITTAKWTAFLNVKKNREYLETRLSRAFSDVEINAKTSIARNVEAGDLQSIKYFHEYTGRYRPNQEIILNLGILIGKIMEVLSSRVEPGVLAEIADEIEEIMTPKQLEEKTG